MMRIDLSAAVTRESVQDTARTFFRWWSGELLALVPNTWQSRASALFRRYTLRLDEGDWRLIVGDGSDLEIQLDPALSDVELRDLIRRIEPRALGERMAVEIPESGVLIRHVRMNAAAKPRLRSAVRLQIERLFPFKANTVACDCHALGHGNQGEIDVEVAVVPIETLDTLRQRLEQIGFEVGQFGVIGKSIRFSGPRSGWTRPEKTQLALAGTALAAATCAILLAPILRDAELQSLNDEIVHLRAPARQAALVLDQWEQLREPLAVVTQRLGQPSYLDVIKSLTNVLPDDAQLSLLTIDGSTVHIEGTARSAKHIADLLGLAHAFSSVRVRDHAQTSNGERFGIFLSLSQPEAPRT
jgi:Tfp pilus assembly protein PilN